MAKKPAKQTETNAAATRAGAKAKARKAAGRKTTTGEQTEQAAPKPAAQRKHAAQAEAKADAAHAADAPREKRVRGEFAMPGSDHALIAKLKRAAKQAGRPTKKNELLRAGLRTLDALGTDALVAVLAALPPARDGKRRTKRANGSA